MRTTIFTRLLFIFLLAAVVFFFIQHTPAAHTPSVCEKETPSLQDAASTQRLWESLSRQFVSIQAY